MAINPYGYMPASYLEKAVIMGGKYPRPKFDIDEWKGKVIELPQDIELIELYLSQHRPNGIGRSLWPEGFFDEIMNTTVSTRNYELSDGSW